jgi:hypothetical protein
MPRLAFGATTQFALPANYSGMLRDTHMWSSRIQTSYQHILSTDEWLMMEVQNYTSAVGRWTIIGEDLTFAPAPSSGETVKYYYRSKYFARDNAANPIAAFASDDNTFRLDEHLLTLGMIWQWRANKGLSYAEDMQNYEEYKERLIASDKGARIIHVGTVRMPVDTEVALPITVSP